MLERINEQVVIIEGNYDNIKITTQEDLYFAKRFYINNNMENDDWGE